VIIIFEAKNSLTWDEAKRKWKNLHKNRDLRKELRPEIYESWERSYHYNIAHCMREYNCFCSESEFKRALENSKYLMETAVPVMEKLLEFVRGTGFIVSLNDANCIGLKTIGDKEALEWAKRSNMVEGLICSEEKAGTNGLPLSISLGKPISVYSYEHFCRFAVAGATSFAPIVDNGSVIGSIGMVAPYQKVSYHTLGMVVSAADHIQSTLMLNRVSKYHQVITDSMSDGVMVVNLSGTITYMNNKCSKILGFTLSNGTGSNLNEVFGDNRENQFFIDAITQGQTLTDEFFILYRGKNQIRCHITCTNLNSPNLFDQGSVIIIRESERINSIVGKWIGHSQMTFDDIIGSNSRFQEIISTAKTASASNSNILLLGESGTGKDIIAQAMHNESSRKNNPFLAINCAALPRELIASELFGYEDGAFTGAKKGGNVGKFELANQGTLFLDEIGDVPVDLQVALLRVLDEKSVIRLGGSRLIPVNVRIITATNKNLEEEIAYNRFRRDLYYRLGVIKLNLPPLRERSDDLPRLVEHFLRLICKRFGRGLKKMTPLALDALCGYEWPGNVRELQNVLEGAVQLVPGEVIDCAFIKNYLKLESLKSLPKIKENSSDESAASDEMLIKRMLDKNEYQSILADLIKREEEMNLLKQLLKSNSNNKSLTAKALGISRPSLYKRLHKYDLL
jgi:transcriptional regulator with PAS, ATPase and Fis domain